jgi:hypothetical protein
VQKEESKRTEIGERVLEGRQRNGRNCWQQGNVEGRWVMENGGVNRDR